MWKKVTDGLSDEQVKLFGNSAMKKLKRVKPYDYNAAMTHVKECLDAIKVDEITQVNRWDAFDYLYFYRNAKKPNLIITLIKKYLYW